MLSKSIFISIFIAVYLRSSVADPPEVIQVVDHADFITHAHQSRGKTVGIIMTNSTTPFPYWMISEFGDIIQQFLIINVVNGSWKFTETKRYFKNTGQYPTLYAMQDGVLMARKLFTLSVSNYQFMRLDIMDPASPKKTGLQVSQELSRPSEERLHPAAESVQSAPAAGTARYTVGSTSGSTAVCTDESPILNRKKGIQFDLNELPIPEDNSSKKRKLSGGSEVTPSFQCTWGATYSYDEPRPSGSASVPTRSGSAKGSSRSPPAQTRSGSGRSSNSPPAPTSSGRSRWPN